MKDKAMEQHKLKMAVRFRMASAAAALEQAGIVRQWTGPSWDGNWAWDKCRSELYQTLRELETRPDCPLYPWDQSDIDRLRKRTAAVNEFTSAAMAHFKLDF